MKSDFWTEPPTQIEHLTGWGWFFAILFAVVAALILVVSFIVRDISESTALAAGCAVFGTLVGVASVLPMFRALPPLESNIAVWIVAIGFLALVMVPSLVFASRSYNATGIAYPIGGAAATLFIAGVLDKFLESLAVIPLSIAGFLLIVFVLFGWAKEQ